MHPILFITPFIASVTTMILVKMHKKLNASTGALISLEAYLLSTLSLTTVYSGSAGVIGSFLAQSLFGLIMFGWFFIPAGAIAGHCLGKHDDKRKMI